MSSKQRASRIPLDYYKQSSPIDRVKNWLTLGAVVLTAGWLAFGFVSGGDSDLRYSRGPVANVHASIDANCQACHVDFAPMSKQNLLMGFLGPPSGHAAVSDSRCEACHKGPNHHDIQRPESTPSCAGCHRDHQGRDFRLTQLPDSDCTSCHKNLDAHLKTDKFTEYEKSIRSFLAGDGHPEFRVLKDKMQDPGVIKFNHKLHMMPGIAIAPGQVNPWKLKDIQKLDAQLGTREFEKYSSAPWQKDSSPEAEVTLDCAACHQLDSGDHRRDGSPSRVPSGVSPDRAAGRYYLPIVYDLHCKACHPLQFDDAKPGYVAPHRVQPADLKDYLNRTYAGQFLEENPMLEVKPVPPGRPLPGKPVNLDEPASRKLKDFVQAKTDAGMKTLLLGKKTCGECHYAVGQTDATAKWTTMPRAIQVGPDEELRQKWFTFSGMIPDVWYQHAKFNHTSHRTVDCRECHANAYDVSVTNKDVLLPGIENCQKCHAPARMDKGLQVAGIRWQCTECHTYHAGDHPLRGVGTKERDPLKRIGIDDFLRGRHE